ncbi:1-deoxy-D-xylulose-5-phosphate reductoisomerase [Corynebacterium ulceribovis]|uniref:1-deoxy-D-xylulose-5-phosphate reductoisomerase n=1 Tax=Corynebacterium ulceribovis TaxID=487732 RepID=UPI000363BAFC|nr:1-deoxy-D-xylulose-5-phosphate reductoisomerase [Corynebacterium ulceribovis]
MTTSILLLGSTGSIGTQAIEVISANPDDFTVAGIAAGGSNPQLIAQQIRQFGLTGSQVAIANPEAAKAVEELAGISGVLVGVDAAEELVRHSAAPIVLNALVGSLGLGVTLATLETGKRLALANKESLVAGGELVMRIAQPGQIVPVDSEHSAMAQCLRSGSAAEVDRLVLTCSGGPFRGWNRQQLEAATPTQAAAHPTWSMGQMNTLNSATLVNKGLELIEAALLFGIPSERIDVTVHPQSIVHSMVTFTDGATIAQASPPSMTLPIALALGWPDRVAGACPQLDWTTAQTWEFLPLDNDTFPAVQLARDCVAGGGMLGAVYNAANEEAAEKFLAGQLSFPGIVDTVAEVLNDANQWSYTPAGLEDVVACERWARARAHEVMAKR